MNLEASLKTASVDFGLLFLNILEQFPRSPRNGLEIKVEIDIPGDVRDFIDEVVDSFVMWDLLIFFSKKAGDAEVPARIAQLLGRSTDDVLRPVKKLEKLTLFAIEKRMDGETVCRINRKSNRFSALERFWAFNESQENRLRILSYLLQKKIR